MKKKMKCAVAVVCLAAAIVAAGWLYNNIPEKAVEAAAKIPAGKDEITGPDLEFLEYYGLEPFETALPTVFIDTDGQRMSKENKTWATVGVLDAAEDGTARSILESPDYTAPVTVKYRGASSYSGFDKSQFRIKFYKKKGSSNAKNYEFLGMGANSEWVLNGPFLDKTLMRNHLVYNVAREIFEWAPDSRFIELFVDGKYQGVYLAVEPVTNGATRLRLSEFGLLSGETSYVVKRDRIGTEDDPLNVYGKTAGKTNNDLFVEYPTSGNLTPEQRSWIEKDISAFEKVLYSDKFADPHNGYAAYIDVDAFVDYFILNEASMNNDAGNLSTYIYKELGGKFQIAVWDFNNAYDNYQWFAQDFTEFFMENNAWFSQLLKDRAFVDKVVKRYEELRKNELSTENYYKALDSYRKELGEAVDRNFAVWGYSFDQNLLIDKDVDRDLRDYESAVTQLKQAIEKRFDFLDHHMTDLYRNCVN